MSKVEDSGNSGEVNSGRGDPRSGIIVVAVSTSGRYQCEEWSGTGLAGQ